MKTNKVLKIIFSLNIIYVLFKKFLIYKLNFFYINIFEEFTHFKYQIYINFKKAYSYL